MDKSALGKRIREERTKLKLTQDALSEKSNITPYYLGEIERGERTLSLDVLISIAGALGSSIDFLLRDNFVLGAAYVDESISRKLQGLTHKQRLTAEAILDAYIESL